MSSFLETWRRIEKVTTCLRLVAVSLPSPGGDAALREQLHTIWTAIQGDGRFDRGRTQLVWQADGKPMSGDIGRGTARSAVKLAKRVENALDMEDLPGIVQLAGGTNNATVKFMQAGGLLGKPRMGGIGVGGYARKIVKEALGEEFDAATLSEEGFYKGFAVAAPLVRQIKEHVYFTSTAVA